MLQNYFHWQSSVASVVFSSQVVAKYFQPLYKCEAIRCFEGLNAVQKPLLHINMAEPSFVLWVTTCSIQAYTYFLINIIIDIILLKYSHVFLILCSLYS